ncbi:MAG TPA: GNAT family N-acetyltransferase [Kineosporiaceae bacterium]|nr:GNAT family N-acetyltransferase [Kineosporiaceae bacterium]
MTRQPIDVRRAGPGDVDDLVQLWSQAREDISPPLRPGGSGPEQIRSRLRAAIGGEDLHVVIARWEGRAAGYVLVRVIPVAALVDGLAVQIEHLFVSPECRRRGVARALLAAVTGIADRVGAEQVVSSAPQAARDSHRFLARLGFSPVVVRRVVATSVLRRKLAGEGRRGGLEDLLSRRRSLRARAGWPRRGETAAPELDELSTDAAVCPVDLETAFRDGMPDTLAAAMLAGELDPVPAAGGGLAGSAGDGPGVSAAEPGGGPVGEVTVADGATQPVTVPARRRTAARGGAAG